MVQSEGNIEFESKVYEICVTNNGGPSVEYGSIETSKKDMHIWGLVVSKG